ncbi:MFS transporter [Desulfatibacillum aliphaticivorans]|uniref:MFS transporter n=1 Tax=Desulfatibacillum aliphaticivorans TaxID=218208 RepID=UPI000400AEB3|nr:MFS transporter [Desulfatibacillum aliphaticivorans]
MPEKAPFPVQAFRPILVCIIGMLAVSCVFMTQAIFLELAQSLQVEETRARLSFSFTSLFYGLSFLLVGPIADRVHQPRMAFGGAVFLALAVLAASFVHDFQLFLVLMAAVGMGASAIPASMFPYMVHTAPPERMGAFVGMLLAFATIGVIVGRLVVGLMTSWWGWEVAFRVMAGIVLACGICVLAFLPKPEMELPADGSGFFRLLLKPFQLMAQPKIITLLFTGFLLFFGFMGMVTFLTYRLAQPPFFYTAREIGLVSLAGLTSLLGAPLSGAFSQKFGWYKVAVFGVSLCLISLQLMGWTASLTPVVIGILMVFLGVYGAQPSIFLEISQSVPIDSTGCASSMYILFCIGGGSMAATLLGPVWNAWGWTGVTLACTASLTASLAMAALAYRRRSAR